MNREIKFRGKQLENIRETDKTYASKKGTWRYGTYKYIHKFYGGVNAYMICDIYGREIMCDKETIGQFTGLLDKNGVEIYEGDKVLINHFQLDEPSEATVLYHEKHAVYRAKVDDDLQPVLYAIDTLEVVGNIHD